MEASKSGAPIPTPRRPSEQPSYSSTPPSRTPLFALPGQVDMEDNKSESAANKGNEKDYTFPVIDQSDINAFGMAPELLLEKGYGHTDRDVSFEAPVAHKSASVATTEAPAHTTAAQDNGEQQQTAPLPAETVTRTASPTAAGKEDDDDHTGREIYHNIPPPLIRDNPTVDTSGNAHEIWEKYPTNAVRTAKYTIFTFLPKNLYEQFRRVANFFFLFVILLQIAPVFQTISVAVSALPLIIIVAVTALKDGFEDWRRWKSDNALNRRLALIMRPKPNRQWQNWNYESNEVSSASIWARAHRLLRRQRKGFFHGCLAVFHSIKSMFQPTRVAGKRKSVVRSTHRRNMSTGSYLGAAQRRKGSSIDAGSARSPMSPQLNSGYLARFGTAAHWQDVKWKHIRVGDIIMIKNNDAIPADCVVLASSEEEPVCYVETKNLDGETNLKVKHAAGAGCLQYLSGLDHEEEEEKSAADLTNTSMAYLEHLQLFLQCEEPHVNMTVFTGTLGLLNWYEKDQNGKVAVEHHSFQPSRQSSPQPPATDAPNLPLQRLIKEERGETTQEHQEPKLLPLSAENLLMRGCILRNTDFVIAIVAYTGEDTKQILNTGDTPSKRSKIERVMNIHVLCQLVFLFLLCLIPAIYNTVWVTKYQNIGDASLFWRLLAESPVYTAFLTFWICLILYQTVVPISLYITVEVVKVIQALFIYGDDEMYHEPTKTRCMPRTWNLSDDLGQIDYIFSDKTGTLTQNVMVFQKCSVNGRAYGVAPGTGGIKGHFVDPQMQQDLQSPNLYPLLNEFWLILAVCHTVLLQRDKATGNVSYQAQSPDEAALVSSARDMGYEFCGRDGNEVYVLVKGEKQTYTILNVLEFSSDRKRMSVIVRRPSGEIVLFCKGADNIIIERCRQGQEEVIAQCSAHLEEFAESGLRTLCLASLPLEEAKYKDWNDRYHRAATGLVDREKKCDALAAEIEVNLTLVGATAIEDKLQDGVPHCISQLKAMGIKVWVLTGDKVETAINIGFLCNLLHSGMDIVIIKEANTPQECIQQLMEAVDSVVQHHDPSIAHSLRSARPSISASMGNSQPSILSPVSPFYSSSTKTPTLTTPGATLPVTASVEQATEVTQPALKLSPLYKEMLSPSQSILSPITSARRMTVVAPNPIALVVDGKSLHHIIDDPDCREHFIKIAVNCGAVMCCRVSPLQKAKVVELIKGKNDVVTGIKPLTLAIGDGANDVGMIQAADIGVGISGLEGLQAAMSSDYAIAQFRFLSRLLLVHGKWSYLRVANLILGFSAKNLLWTLVLWWYFPYSGGSGQESFDFSFTVFYNVMFTLIPVGVLGIFDRDVSDETAVKFPQLYRRRGRYSHGLVILTLLESVYMSLICFFFPLTLYDDNINPSAQGDAFDRQMLCSLMAVSAVFAANLIVTLRTLSWTWPIFASLILSSLTIVIFIPLYGIFNTYNTQLNGVAAHLYIRPDFWLGLLLIVTVCVIPGFIVRYLMQQLAPSDEEIVREMEVSKKHRDASGRWHPHLFHRASTRRQRRADPTTGQPADLTSPISPVSLRQFPLVRRDSSSSFVYDFANKSANSHRGFSFSQSRGVGSLVLSPKAKTKKQAATQKSPKSILRRLSRAAEDIPPPMSAGSDHLSRRQSDIEADLADEEEPASAVVEETRPEEDGSSLRRAGESDTSLTSSNRSTRTGPTVLVPAPHAPGWRGMSNQSSSASLGRPTHRPSQLRQSIDARDIEMYAAAIDPTMGPLPEVHDAAHEHPKESSSPAPKQP